MTKQRIEETVAQLGNGLANELGYELVEVEYRKEGPQWVLRCTIDNSNGIGTQDCQRFSEAFEKVLDRADPIPGAYLLEVSSPGIERPLKKDQDFERFAGQQVEIKLCEVMDGQKTIRGELMGIERNRAEVVIRVKTNQTVKEIPREKIAKARLVVEIFGFEGGKQRK